jgi:hypothetical protein
MTGIDRRGFLGLAVGAAVSRTAGQDRSPEIVLDYTFSESSRGWLPEFADYSLATASLQRIAEIRPLPGYPPEYRGYYLQSMNRSDDVFMFLKQELGSEDGVQGNRLYSISIYTLLLSDAGSNCVGAGGAPGESVYFKAGVSLDEPVPTLANSGFVALNVDKGNQASGGLDGGVAGNIANGLPCEEPRRWVLLERLYHHPRLVRTDERGQLWVFVGTDSGYEGLTALYYYRIVVTLRPLPDPSGAPVTRGTQ